MKPAAEDKNNEVASQNEPRLIPIIGAGESFPAPAVTVLVTRCQSENSIWKCLENLARQTFFSRCEIILINDGSLATESAKLTDFQLRFPNVCGLHALGESSGLPLAHGRFLAEIKTDDGFHDRALEMLVAALERYPDCAMAYGNVAWTTQPNDVFPSENTFRTITRSAFTPVQALFPGFASGLNLWRSDSLRTLGCLDHWLPGDHPTKTMRLIESRMKAVYVPETLTLIHQNKDDSNTGHHSRPRFEIKNIFQVEPDNLLSEANAWTTLGYYAAKIAPSQKDHPFEHGDFAFSCFYQALELDPESSAAGMHIVVLNDQLKRLESEEIELVRRFPKMRDWIALYRSGEGPHVPLVKHALIGPVYRPSEFQNRPTAEQLAREPEALRPWICRIDGRHVYLGEDIFMRPAGLSYQTDELQSATRQLVTALMALPRFYAHFGGAGDAILLLAAFYDQSPASVVFSYPNSVGATRALFDGFPKLSKIYFLPQHTESFFHMVLRFATITQLRNCLGAGTTPVDSYDVEWKAGLDIEKKYRIHKKPRWAADFRKNKNSRRIALAPRGSLTGMVGSKRNIIDPKIWPEVIAHIQQRGFEPVILGMPAEAKEYPALPGCADVRHESFAAQMHRTGECAGLVGADSWAKTFSALAEIPTLVFDPLKSGALVAWKDPSDWIFIEPWPAIKVVRKLEDFRREFDVHLARIIPPSPRKSSTAVIAWEGSFLDYGSLSHVNRELTSRLSRVLNLCCVNAGAAQKPVTDANLHECAKTLRLKSPTHAAVTVRHQWPPDWSRPQSGALVVIQPWEYGSLPKAWVANEKNVDEFWVPSPAVRAMYLGSGIAPEKVRVIPNGVDTKKFHPGVPPMTLATKKKFKFLFVGGTIFRKGPDILLEAFARAFTAADDVCLVIKDFGGDSFYRGQTAGAAIHAIQGRPGAPEILHLTEDIPAHKMPALYTACDCLVLPYRGEGFGLPVLEAMACGVPVVVTGGGATDSFVPSDAGWKISSRGVLLGDHVGEIPLVSNGWLLEPSARHLDNILKFAASHPEECKKRGRQGRLQAEKRFDWHDITAIITHRLRELAELAPVSLAAASGENIGNGTTGEMPSVSPPIKHKELTPAALVGHLIEARNLLGQKKFPAAWQATCAALERRPFHPEAFLLLAEIALAAGDSISARACAQRARSLAPAWKLARQFLNQSLKGNARLDWLKLPEERPPRLSVCLIVKNEENFLAQCLKSVRHLAQQIVVVDTGSTDRTLEIAKEFGAEIHPFAWCDDFAAARNAALEHATGDWVLMLDADEELAPDQSAPLLADMQKPGLLAGRLPLVNLEHEAEGHSFVPRLFRNAPGVFYSSRVHEQIFPCFVPLSKTWGLEVGFGAARLLHHGYTKEMVRDRNKIKRNLTLLRQAVVENPSDANLMMNFGLELVRSDDLAGGLEKYREAFDLMSAQTAEETAPELREVLLTQFTCHLYKVQAHDEVVRVLQSPLAASAGLTASLHFALGLALFELKQFAECAEQMRQCIAKRHEPARSPINTDILTVAPEHCLALSLAKSGDAVRAEKAFQSALAGPATTPVVKLDYAKFLAAQNRPLEAFHQLHELVAADSRHLAAWQTGGEIALTRPEFLEFARDWTGEAVRHLPEDFTLTRQRAEVLLLGGELKPAAELWERLWNSERQPAILAALILCEAVESTVRHLPDKIVDEPATSRAFIKWYQKLIAMKAHALIPQINGRLAEVSRALPTAARMLEQALAAPQPCAA